MSRDIVGDHRRTIRDYDKRLDEVIAERDKLQAQLLRLHRIVNMASHLTHDEVKALEASRNTEACIAINAWNAKSNTEAKCRENRELRSSLRSIIELIDDSFGDKYAIERIRAMATDALDNRRATDTGATT